MSCALARGLLMVPLLAALAACATADCDPSTAGFIGGIGCSASGAYDQREFALKQTLGQAEANALEQQLADQREHAAAAAAQQDLQARQQKLAKLNDQLAELKRRLDAARARQGTDQTALASAEDQFAALRKQRETIGTDPQEAQLSVIDRRQSQLLKLLNDMM